MKISIVIPTLNEEDYIGKILDYTLKLQGDYEIIVSDGGSTDATKQVVSKFDEVILIPSEKGRAIQMNTGASVATGEILLFLHADTFLPEKTYWTVVDHLKKEKHVGGSFRLKLDKDHILLKFYTWCSRFSFEIFTYGDHGIFVKNEIFKKIKGFRKMPFLEDIEIQKRLRKEGRFKKINLFVTTSARRFEKTGTIKQLTIDFLILIAYHLKIPPAKLKRFYRDHGS